MSGGSYNYAYIKVDEFLHSMNHRNDPLRIAFREHLEKVSEAMRSIEWVDSCDKSPGDEHEHIRACFDSPAPILAAVVKEAEQRIETLRAAIELCKEMSNP